MSAFVQLVFERRYTSIRVVDLVAAAGVGRATFYEHFANKDAVLVAAMEPVLLPLANAATGRGAKAQMRSTLQHLWDRRSVGRALFGSAAGRKLERELAGVIRIRMDDRAAGDVPLEILAAGAAAAQLAMLRRWIEGGATCSVDAMARRMLACASLTR